MQYEPGRLLLVTYPFTDQTAAKQRPVLVISAIQFNSGEDIVVLPVSSRSGNESFGFKIASTEPYFPQTLLRTASVVKWTKPMTISSKVVSRRLGIVPPAILKQIQELVRSVFS